MCTTFSKITFSKKFVTVFVRTQTVKVPKIFEEYTNSILEALLKGFRQTELIVDIYQNYNIKNSERLKRGTSEKIITKSVKDTKNLSVFFEKWG